MVVEWVREEHLDAVAVSAAEALGLDVYHGYSANVREWAGHRLPLPAQPAAAARRKADSLWPELEPPATLARGAD